MFTLVLRTAIALWDCMLKSKIKLIIQSLRSKLVILFSIEYLVIVCLHRCDCVTMIRGTSTFLNIFFAHLVLLVNFYTIKLKYRITVMIFSKMSLKILSLNKKEKKMLWLKLSKFLTNLILARVSFKLT